VKTKPPLRGQLLLHLLCLSLLEQGLLPLEQELFPLLHQGMVVFPRLDDGSDLP
jgi:hypothetical protein